MSGNGYPHHAEIIFGSWREENQQPQSFSFKTREELDAFMQGVEEGVGWMDHEVVFDSRYPEDVEQDENEEGDEQPSAVSIAQAASNIISGPPFREKEEKEQ